MIRCWIYDCDCDCDCQCRDPVAAYAWVRNNRHFGYIGYTKPCTMNGTEKKTEQASNSRDISCRIFSLFFLSFFGLVIFSNQIFPLPGKISTLGKFSPETDTRTKYIAILDSIELYLDQLSLRHFDKRERKKIEGKTRVSSSRIKDNGIQRQ